MNFKQNDSCDQKRCYSNILYYFIPTLVKHINHVNPALINCVHYMVIVLLAQPVALYESRSFFCHSSQTGYRSSIPKNIWKIMLAMIVRAFIAIFSSGIHFYALHVCTRGHT